MGTRNNPGKFDCHASAEPDEPMFILLARDASAADLVDLWADKRLAAIRADAKPESDLAMVREAQDCARAMRDWRRQHRTTEEAQ